MKTTKNVIPMIDCHRHLGGCASVGFAMYAMEQGCSPKIDRRQVERLMVCQEDEPRDFLLFLSKFRYLDKMVWTKKLIDKKIEFVCDEWNDKIDGAFLDFSISKYRRIGWSVEEAILFIFEAISKHSKIPIIPILSIKYESPDEVQLKIAEIINNPKIADKIGGVDFVGNTAKIKPHLQKRICEMWNGKMVRMHVGETDSAENIRLAIKDIGVTNIAHGIKIIENQEFVDLGRNSDVVFDIAPSGNYTTGAIKENSKHPAKAMFENGLKMTIGTDDPVQFKTTLKDEFVLLKENDFNNAQLDELKQNGSDQFEKWAEYSIL